VVVQGDRQRESSSFPRWGCRGGKAVAVVSRGLKGGREEAVHELVESIAGEGKCVAAVAMRRT